MGNPVIKPVPGKSAEEQAVWAEVVQAGKELLQLLNIPVEDYTPRYAEHIAWALEQAVWEALPGRAIRALREADKDTLGQIHKLINLILH